MRETLIVLLFCAACRTPPEEPRLENLIRRDVSEKLASNVEVIMSVVELPPHRMLPWHTHPGEEFGYLLDGAVVLMTAEGETRFDEPGTAMHVPRGIVHTARTDREGARLLVVRVHEKGRPERTPAEAPHGHDHAHE